MFIVSGLVVSIRIQSPILENTKFLTVEKAAGTVT